MNLIDGIEAFLKVAETGSFAEAARRMSVSPSAISKLISRTERQLGARLINRNTRGLSLTQEGKSFLQHSRTIINALGQAKEELSAFREVPEGKLKVSFPNMPSFFGPVMSLFLKSYPEIHVEADLSDRIVDVIDEGFDVVIRAGSLVDSRLTARSIGRWPMNLVASPAYLEEHGIPLSIEELSAHKTLSYRYPSSGRFEQWMLTESTVRLPELTALFACNSTDIRLSLALLGNGIIFLPGMLTEKYIDSGQLKKILEKEVAAEYELSIIWPANKLMTPRVRVFIDFISDYFDKEMRNKGVRA